MLMAVFCLGASLIGINAQEKDWANLQRYAQQNAELPKPDKNEKRVVFMGNSITEGWVNTHPDFFKSNGYIGRGIGGQTSYQFWYVSGRCHQLISCTGSNQCSHK